MRERLEAFREVCEQYAQADSGSLQWSRAHEQLTSAATQQMPTVRKILNSLQSGLGDQVRGPSQLTGMTESLRGVQQGLGILDDRDEWAVRLAPDTPTILADRLHPHVWTAASALWDTGQYRVAVQQACVSLSAHIAAKAGSSLTERDLVADVFSPNEPREGSRRLHFPGERTKTWRSRQEGLHLMAQGVFAGIRNVSTHSPEEWTEQQALELLAALSVVARWTDETVATDSI